jgi:hypothetical protein
MSYKINFILFKDHLKIELEGFAKRNPSRKYHQIRMVDMRQFKDRFGVLTGWDILKNSAMNQSSSAMPYLITL